jgi:hypothetical protein
MKNSNTSIEEITIENLCKTLLNLSTNLEGKNLQAVQIAAYIIDKSLWGFITLNERKKLEIEEFINNFNNQSNSRK